LYLRVIIIKNRRVVFNKNYRNLRFKLRLWKNWALGRFYRANWKSYNFGRGITVKRYQRYRYGRWYLRVVVYRSGRVLMNKAYRHWRFTVKQWKRIILKKYGR